MKKLLMGVLLAGLGYAGMAAADTGDLVVLKDGCRLYNGAGEQVFTTAVQVSHTQSGTQYQYTCAATGVANSTGQSANFDSGSNASKCGVASKYGYVVADSWRETVNADGSTTLMCEYKKVAPDL